MLTKKKFDRQRRAAERVFERLRQAGTLEKRIKISFCALRYFIFRATGYYSAAEIERAFIDRARSIHIELPSRYEKGKCLLVTTRTYEFGGHTRLIERWIEYDKATRYSLAVLNGGVATERLRNAIVTCGGKIHMLEGHGDYIEKGVELRKIAAEYESVFLFSLDADPIPLIAFGTSEFKRPVVLRDHIDHLFYLGLGVADLMVCGRRFSYEIAKYRGIKDGDIHFCPLPMERKNRCCLMSQKCAREQLGINGFGKIIVSCGREMKYRPIGTGSFLDYVVPLLKRFKDLLVIVIGADENDFPQWGELSKSYDSRFRLIKRVPHESLYVYYCAADLVIDSFPLEGPTSLQDAVFCDRPILSRTDKMDWVVTSPAHCRSQEEVVAKAEKILETPDVARQYHRATLQAMLDFCGEEAFGRRRDALMKKVKTLSHHVRVFESRPTNMIPNDAIKETQFGNPTALHKVLMWLLIHHPHCILDQVAFFIQFTAPKLGRYLRRTGIRG